MALAGWLNWRGSSGDLFPAMPPEVIRWDIEISQRVAFRPPRTAAGTLLNVTLQIRRELP